MVVVVVWEGGASVGGAGARREGGRGLVGGLGGGSARLVDGLAVGEHGRHVGDVEGEGEPHGERVEDAEDAPGDGQRSKLLRLRDAGGAAGIPV